MTLIAPGRHSPVLGVVTEHVVHALSRQWLMSVIETPLADDPFESTLVGLNTPSIVRVPNITETAAQSGHSRPRRFSRFFARERPDIVLIDLWNAEQVRSIPAAVRAAHAAGAKVAVRLSGNFAGSPSWTEVARTRFSLRNVDLMITSESAHASIVPSRCRSFDLPEWRTSPQPVHDEPIEVQAFLPSDGDAEVKLLLQAFDGLSMDRAGLYRLRLVRRAGSDDDKISQMTDAVHHSSLLSVVTEWLSDDELEHRLRRTGLAVVFNPELSSRAFSCAAAQGIPVVVVLSRGDFAPAYDYCGAAFSPFEPASVLAAIERAALARRFRYPDTEAFRLGTHRVSERLSQLATNSGTGPLTRPVQRSVAIVTPHYLPHIGGVETHVAEVAPRLVGAGYDPRIITTRPGRQTRRTEHIGGIEVRRHRTLLPRTDFGLAPGVFRDVLKGGDALVHCQGVHTAVAPLAMAACLLARTPYIVTFHTGGHSSSTRVRGRALQWRLLAPLLRRASALIAVCEFERDLFASVLRIAPESIAVIRNGADLPREVSELPAACSPTPGNEFHVVTIGRLERYKGHHRVIDAVATMTEAAHLSIVGRGPYEQELRRQVAESGLGQRVEFVHFDPSQRREFAELVRSAHVVTLMSEYEAHPVAVMEALGLRRPVVVADTTGLCELARAGWVTAVPLDATPETLAAALIRAADGGAASVELPTWDECASAIAAQYAAAMGATSAETVATS
jgi:glycogen synthase